MRAPIWAVGSGVLAAVVLYGPIGLASGRAPEEAQAIAVPAEAVAAAVPTASFAPLVDAVRPAVVALEVEVRRQGRGDIDPSLVPESLRPFVEGQRVRGQGSGFVISPEGYLLTNNHVIEDATNITALFADGRRVSASVVGADPATDVALLKLAGDETWPHVALNTDGTPAVGDWVVAVGNPLGLGITVTAGIVSGTGRVLGHDAYDDFIQTDAAINQGNSGGPLFDTRGRVIGMNTAIIQGANTVGFAVPASVLSDVLGDLRSEGRVSRGYIGVELRSVDAALAGTLGVPKGSGALVASVQPGTPAAGAGLESGDVIVRFGRMEVTDAQGLIREVARHDPGEKIDLRVLREGEVQTVTLTLAERPGR